MKKKQEKVRKHYDKSQICIKILAVFVAVLMIGSTGATLIYALIG